MTHNGQNVQNEPHNLKQGANSRETDSIGHKTQNKDKQNKNNTENLWKGGGLRPH